MDIIFLQEYTVEHKKPEKVAGRVSKRQLDALPNFTCHAFVAASAQNPETLFAGLHNGDLVTWRYVAGKEEENTKVSILGSHGGSVTCILHHPEYSRFLFTGASDATIKVWDPFGLGIEGNKCIQTIRAPYGHDATVTALAAHCDILLSCSCDKTLKVWKPDEGRSGLKYPWFVVKQLFLFDYWTTCVWSFPSKIAEDTLGEVYVGDAGGGLTMLRSVVAHQIDTDRVMVDRLELVKHHRHFRALGITQILPLPTLNVVLTLSYDDSVRLSDITNLETLVSLANKERPGQRFVDMVWSAAEEELVLADATGTLTVWNSRADKLVCETHAGHRVGRLSIIEHRGQHVVLASTSDSVKCFAITRSLPYKQHMGHQQRVLGLHVWHGGETAGVDGLSEGVCAVSASVDNTICFWSVLDSLQCTKTFTERRRNSEISAFLYVPQEGVVVTGHENGSLRIWNPQTDKSWRVGAGGDSGPGHGNTVSALGLATHRFTVSGMLEECAHVASTSYDGTVAVWEIRADQYVSPRLLLKWQVSREEQLCVVFDPIRKTYLVGGNDGIITMWSLKDPRKEAQVGLFRGPEAGPYGDYPSHETGAVTALALDGNYLFSGGEDERIIMWSTFGPPFERLRVFHDEGEINSLLVIPDSGDLLTCSRAGTVLQWTQHGKVVARFDSPHKEELRCLAYCRKQDEIYVGTEEGGILRITLSPVGPGDSARARLRGDEEEIEEDIDGGTAEGAVHGEAASAHADAERLAAGVPSPGAKSIPEEIRAEEG